MAEDMTFKQLFTNPDGPEHAEIWVEVMELAKKYEDEHGYERSIVLEGLLDGMLDLAYKREDQPYFAHMDDARRFYLLAAQIIQRTLDEFPSHETQKKCEDIFGKDMVGLRMAHQYGWKENPLEED